jgi:hypothetical protein
MTVNAPAVPFAARSPVGANAASIAQMHPVTANANTAKTVAV